MAGLVIMLSATPAAGQTAEPLAMHCCPAAGAVMTIAMPPSDTMVMNTRRQTGVV